MRVDVIIIGDAQEIADMCDLLISTMQQAGWTINLLAKAVSGPNVSGILVGTHVNSDRHITDAAAVLVASLQSAGIFTRLFAPQFDNKLPMALLGSWDDKNVAPIRILVSAKP